MTSKPAKKPSKKAPPSPPKKPVDDGTHAVHGARLSRQSAILRAQGYIGIAEVSRLLCNDISTVYTWFDKKIVEGVQIGHRKYIKLSSLIEHVGNDVARIFGLLNLQQTINQQTSVIIECDDEE